MFTRNCRRCKSSYLTEDSKQRVCFTCREHCSGCGKTLTEDNQDWHSRFKRNNYVCKECVANRVKVTKGNKGFNQRAYDFKRNYGITEEEYNSLFSKQEGRCKICEESFDKLCVDHCHTSLEVRGLLCSSCNLALGLFKDSTKSLNNAIRYLSNASTVS